MVESARRDPLASPPLSLPFSLSIPLSASLSLARSLFLLFTASTRLVSCSLRLANIVGVHVALRASAAPTRRRSLSHHPDGRVAASAAATAHVGSARRSLHALSRLRRRGSAGR